MANKKKMLVYFISSFTVTNVEIRSYVIELLTTNCSDRVYRPCVYERISGHEVN